MKFTPDPEGIRRLKAQVAAKVKKFEAEVNQILAGAEGRPASEVGEELAAAARRHGIDPDLKALTARAVRAGAIQ